MCVVFTPVPAFTKFTHTHTHTHTLFTLIFVNTHTTRCIYTYQFSILIIVGYFSLMLILFVKDEEETNQS